MENIIPLQTTIPLNKIAGNVNDFIEEFQSVLAPFMIKNIKKEQKARELEETYYQNILKLKDLRKEKKINDFTYKTLKARLTITKYMDKMRQKKWVEKIMTGLKGLAQKGSNIFFDILKMLMLMSIFPGLADMIFGIINTVIGFAVKLIVEHAPAMFKELGRIINEVLPKFIKQLGNTILDAFNIPPDHPLRGLVNTLAENAPLIFAIWGALSVFIKYAPGILAFFKIIFAIAKGALFVGKILLGIGKVIWFIFQIISFVTGIAIGWIVLIVALVILVGVLIWKFRKQIWEFFTVTIPEAFWKLVDAVKEIAPKLWKTVTNIFTSVITFLKKWGKKFFDFLFSPYKKLWNTLKNLFSKISSMVSFDEIKNKLVEAVKSLPDNLLSAFGNLKNKIKEKVMSIADGFVELVQYIMSYLKSYSFFGGKEKENLNFLASYGSKASEGKVSEEQIKSMLGGEKTIDQIAQQYQGEDQSYIKEYLKGIKELSRNNIDKKDMGDLREAVLSLKESSKNVVKVAVKKKKV